MMGIPEDVLYVGLPYAAIVLFVVVPIYRKRTNKIDWDWTTRASGLFDNRGIGIASVFLHWGLLLLFGGHLLGIAAAHTGALGFLGFGSGTYTDAFFWVGALGGLMAMFGSMLALIRRTLSPRMRTMSTPQDYVIHLFLLLILGTALYQSLIIGVFGVSTSVFAWFVGLLTLNPDPSLIGNQSLVMRIHVVASFLFWAYFPFTKLVHVWSAPLGYLVRPYITMRGYESIYPEESGD